MPLRPRATTAHGRLAGGGGRNVRPSGHDHQHLIRPAVFGIGIGSGGELITFSYVDAGLWEEDEDWYWTIYGPDKAVGSGPWLAGSNLFFTGGASGHFRWLRNMELGDQSVSGPQACEVEALDADRNLLGTLIELNIAAAMAADYEEYDDGEGWVGTVFRSSSGSADFTAKAVEFQGSFAYIRTWQYTDPDPSDPTSEIICPTPSRAY
jgi:hypothetical protein